MNKKIINITTIIIFIAIIFPLTIMLIIKQPSDHSEEENRALQTFPDFDMSTFLDGEFTGKINEYFNDQFPLRNQFVGIKSIFETLQLKRQNNNVLLGKNGQLAVRNFSMVDGLLHPLGFKEPVTDNFYPEHVNTQLEGLLSFAEIMEERSIPYSVVLPPRTIDIAASAFSYPSTYSDALLSQVSKKLENINYVDIATDMRKRYDNGEYVYYKTDHHWTTLGAYYVYSYVMESLGTEPYPIEDFEIETASEEFYGTTYSKGGYKTVDPDTIQFFHHKSISADQFVTEIISNKESSCKTFDTFYDRSFLDKKDKYSVFASETNPYMTIKKKDGGDRETMLIFKDSFVNSMIPFLALHYDLIIVNLQNWSSIMEMQNYSITKELGKNYLPVEFDKVLLVYNFENIVSFDKLASMKDIEDFIDYDYNREMGIE